MLSMENEARRKRAYKRIDEIVNFVDDKFIKKTIREYFINSYNILFNAVKDELLINNKNTTAHDNAFLLLSFLEENDGKTLEQLSLDYEKLQLFYKDILKASQKMLNTNGNV